MSIAGQRVVVTGANSGIGEATAAELASRGAAVTITVRDPVKGSAAASRIRAATGVDVDVELLDLARLDLVREFAARFCDRHDRLDVLVNNAGVMSGKRRETPDGFEWTFGVNHLGPFLLTTLLTPLVVDSAPARIINVSSEVHRSAKRGLDFADLHMERSYSPSRAYAASKLANILFTVELDRRLGELGVTARALHPGVVATSFGKGSEGSWRMGMLMTVRSPVLRKPARGAATTVHLATAPDAAISGGLYWSDEQPKEPAPAAVDPAAAQRLWAESERLVEPIA
jgi:NAD(P)-dependent dehydrogenase (short-subunit alcohol dehydrogenase family)